MKVFKLHLKLHKLKSKIDRELKLCKTNNSDLFKKYF